MLRGSARSARLDDELLPAARAILATSGVFTLTDLPAEVSSECAVRVVVRMLSSSLLRVVE